MARKTGLKRKNEEGQAIVLLVLALIALIAFVGLATDVALIYVAQQHLQRAVDAAALAAANKLPDQVEARDAAYEFTRLHGYVFAPDPNPLALDIAFPIVDPPRKIAAVTGTIEVDLAFLQVIGWDQAQVSAAGVGESAPLDVYLVLDLSNSMVYDTPRPWWWNDDAERAVRCPPTGCPYCGQSDDGSWTQCRAYYCNDYRNCNPLDVHIKDSAGYFVDQLDPLYDRVGVIAYDSQGSLTIALTDDFDTVKTAIDNMNAFEPYAVLCTNIGDGIAYADYYMGLPPPPGGQGGRQDSIWSVVLLTDGRANRYRLCPTCQPYDCSPWTGYCELANTWATSSAQNSWDNHRIVYYTIAYGDIFFNFPQYQQLMIDIADITDNGTIEGTTENFWAVPDEAGLRQALAEIAERIYTRLLR